MDVAGGRGYCGGGGDHGREAGAQADRIASAFRRKELAVSVEPDPAHAGRIALWVGDQALADEVSWQLDGTQQVDVLGRFPIGVDVRDRPFTITLADKNVLFGAMPDYGKTATLRLILLAAALDPRVKIYAFDLKGGTDLLPLESCAVRVVNGDEDEDVAELLEALREVRAEISARNRYIRGLPIHERTDGKLTSSDATRLGSAPIVFAIDEAQIVYEHETYGQEIAKLTTDIFKRGRSGASGVAGSGCAGQTWTSSRATRSARSESFAACSCARSAAAFSSGV